MNIRQMSNHMTARMTAQTFHLFYLVSIIRFLWNFKLACDINRIHEEEAMSLFNFSVKKPISSALYMRLASKQNCGTRIPSKRNLTTLTTYPQASSYLLWTYATDAITAESKEKKTTFNQPPNKTLLQYDEELAVKTVPEGDISKERELNEVFSSKLERPTRLDIKGYLS